QFRAVAARVVVYAGGPRGGLVAVDVDVRPVPFVAADDVHEVTEHERTRCHVPALERQVGPTGDLRIESHAQPLRVDAPDAELEVLVETGARTAPGEQIVGGGSFRRRIQ